MLPDTTGYQFSIEASEAITSSLKRKMVIGLDVLCLPVGDKATNLDLPKELKTF